MKAIQFDVSVPRYVLGKALGLVYEPFFWSGFACMRYGDAPEPDLPGPVESSDVSSTENAPAASEHAVPGEIAEASEEEPAVGPEQGIESAPTFASTIRAATFRARLHVVQSLRQTVDAFGENVFVSRQTTQLKLQMAFAQHVQIAGSALESQPSLSENVGIDLQG